METNTGANDVRISSEHFKSEAPKTIWRVYCTRKEYRGSKSSDLGYSYQFEVESEAREWASHLPHRGFENVRIQLYELASQKED